MNRSVFLWVCFATCLSLPAADRLNVLMIAIDDMNDWVGFMGGHPHAHTPSMDRLAARGMVFMNAHTASPHCGPARTALMSGLHPSTTGIYAHIKDEDLKRALPETVVYLSNWFGNNGYKTMGRGKLFHGNAPEGAFQILEGRESVPFGPKPEKRFKWNSKGTGTDWGVFPETDEAVPDIQTARWAADRLKERHDAPFFLAVGFVLPHVPWYAPRKWFDLHPADALETPLYLKGDLSDVPELGRAIAHLPAMPTTEWMLASGEWQKTIQAYLATISMTDYCVGIVLDALERSGHADDTVVVLWSDHGYHMGEKNRFAKQSLWNRSTRVPLVFVAPGFESGRKTEAPVSLMDVYPTLLEICGLPPNRTNEGVSLVPLMREPNREWSRHVLITYGDDNHAVRSRSHTYIRYEDGSEELYDDRIDPNQWINLAAYSQYDKIKAALKKSLPETVAPWSPYTRIECNDYFTEKSANYKGN